MSMYSLPRITPLASEVHPQHVLYRLPNYHEGAENFGTNGSDAHGEPTLSDPVQLIEQKQLELIKSLTSLGDKLNDVLKKKGKDAAATPSPVVKSTKAAPEAKKTKESTPVADSTEDQKKEGKEKDAKKEARKAAKLAAKSKVATGEAPATTGKARAPESASAWVIHEERSTTETGQSLTACLKAHASNFPSKALNPAITLKFTNGDICWVKALSTVAAKRGVSFKGAVVNEVANATSVVTNLIADSTSISTNEGVLFTRAAIWKYLGTGIGMFSTDHTHTIHSAHQQQWLAEANLVLTGKQTLETLIRSASRFLSSFDTLGAQFDISIADIVVRSLIPATHSQLPNNVELWAKRIDSL